MVNRITKNEVANISSTYVFMPEKALLSPSPKVWLSEDTGIVFPPWLSNIKFPEHPFTIHNCL